MYFSAASIVREWATNIFAGMYFSSGQKSSEDRKYPKNTQKILEKKFIKRSKINIENFTIMYFSRMEFKSLKSQIIDAGEKYTFYSIRYTIFAWWLNITSTNLPMKDLVDRHELVL